MKIRAKRNGIYHQVGAIIFAIELSLAITTLQGRGYSYSENI